MSSAADREGECAIGAGLDPTEANKREYER
jgi:hypothetical protein